MRKILAVILFTFSIISILLLGTVQDNYRSKKETNFETACEKTPSSDFATERAHGVILRNNTIAALRLSGEKNYSPPGGHLEAYETPRDALIREIDEELKLDIDQLSTRPYRTYCDVIGATKTQRTHVYFIDSWQNTLQIKEGDQLKWVGYDYRLDTNADSELITLLEYLKRDGYLKTAI